MQAAAAAQGRQSISGACLLLAAGLTSVLNSQLNDIQSLSNEITDLENQLQRLEQEIDRLQPESVACSTG
jgi:peptidoglycan hydrolase CwlO-like protein